MDIDRLFYILFGVYTSSDGNLTLFLDRLLLRGGGGFFFQLHIHLSIMTTLRPYIKP